MPGYPTHNQLATYDHRYYREETGIFGLGMKLSKHFVVEYTIYSDISTPVSQFDRANEWSFTYRVPLGG